MSKNINIDVFELILKKNSCFVRKYQHFGIKHDIGYFLTIFRGKDRNFEIILKKSFIVFKSSNINITRNITLFWDHFENFVYCQSINISRKRTFLSLLKIVFIRIYQYFDHADVFWNHFEKIVFCPYLRKYQRFGVKHDHWKKIDFCP